MLLMQTDEAQSPEDNPKLISFMVKPLVIATEIELLPEALQLKE